VNFVLTTPQNALVGGWGNAGGGITFVVMIALFNKLRDDGLSSSTSWRAAFAIVPVPILLTVAAMCLIFGTDHPAGKWSQRHNVLGTKIAAARGHQPVLDHAEVVVLSEHPKEDQKDKEKGEDTEVTVAGVSDDSPPGTWHYPIGCRLGRLTHYVKCFRNHFRT
jgi:NNP family nitrate/nitrite transporter-like MFS transporter